MKENYFQKKCPKCGNELTLKETIIIPDLDKDKEIIICPFCKNDFEIMSRGTIVVTSKKV